MDSGESGQVPLICGTLLLGGVLLVLGLYLAGKRRQQRAANQAAGTTSKNVTDTDKKSEQREVNSPASVGGGNSKRQAKSKKRREAQQEFSHSWMVGTLKGHTGPVLDMDFSANGKYLASSAEDCCRETDMGGIYRQQVARSPANTGVFTAARNRSPVPAARTISTISNTSVTSAPPSPGKSSSRDSSSSSSSFSQEEQRIGKTLSRRQRKNRREQRKDDAKKEQEASSAKPEKMANPTCGEAQSATCNAKIELAVKKQPAHFYYRLNKELEGLNTLTDMQYMRLLRKHCLTQEQLRFQGFPMKYGHYVSYFNSRKSRHLASVEWDMVLQHFYNNPVPLFKAEKIQFIATDRCPDEEDSGHGSAPSSVESSDADVDGSDSCSSSESDAEDGYQPYKPKYMPAHKRECTRCSKFFYVNAETGEYLFREKCSYHWGKLRRCSVDYSSGSSIKEYQSCYWECCQGREYARGCTTAKHHVWSGSVPGFNGPCLDYVETEEPKFYAPFSNYGVFAIDCEMVYTQLGMELAKVSVVDLCGHLVYNEVVRPVAPVIDCNTRFSGLRLADLQQATKTLQDVQQDLLGFINSHTILIGHSLENDLRALKIIHGNVVDTSISYPHALGPPLRRSLKEVARTELNKDIQLGEHDSTEDARATIDLTLLKMQKDVEWLYLYYSQGC